MNNKSAVDSTKLRKRIPYTQKVNVESEINRIEESDYEYGKPRTRNAEILVYEGKGFNISPQGMVMAMRQASENKYFRKAELQSYKINSSVIAEITIAGQNHKVRLSTPEYRRRQAESFYRMLAFTLQEVQCTLMHLAMKNLA